MKTSIRTILFMMAGLILGTACSKDPQDVPQMSTIQIHATLETTTKGAWETEYAESDGIKVSWEESDVLYVFAPDGSFSEFTVTDLGDDGSATFTGSLSVAEGSRISAMLKNSAVKASAYDASNKVMTADLSHQDGTLEDAGNHDVLFASGTFKGGNDPLDLSFEHKNSIAKFILKYTYDDDTTSLSSLALSSGPVDAKSYRNSMAVSIEDGSVENLQASGTDGDITIFSSVTPYKMGADGSMILYVSIPAYPFQNSILDGESHCDPCLHKLWRVAGSETLTPSSGTTYSLSRSACEDVRTGTIWMSDLDTTINAKSISENRTGSPRLTVASRDLWGRNYTCNVLQINEKDLGGHYALTGDAKVVDMSPEVSKATSSASGTYGVKGGMTTGLYYDSNWAIPDSDSGASTALTLTYSSANENNISVDGFYEGLTMPGKVVLSRSEQKVTMDLIIENKASLMDEGTYAGEYLAFQTELIQNTSEIVYEQGFGHGGKFCFKGTVSVDDSSVRIDFASRQICTDYPNYQVYGILLNRYSADGNGDTSGTYLIRSTANPYCKSNVDRSGAAYVWILQGDFSMSKDISTASAGGINATGYNKVN